MVFSCKDLVVISICPNYVKCNLVTSFAGVEEIKNTTKYSNKRSGDRKVDNFIKFIKVYNVTIHF